MQRTEECKRLLEKICSEDLEIRGEAIKSSGTTPINQRIQLAIDTIYAPAANPSIVKAVVSLRDADLQALAVLRQKDCCGGLPILEPPDLSFLRCNARKKVFVSVSLSGGWVLDHHLGYRQLHRPTII